MARWSGRVSMKDGQTPRLQKTAARVTTDDGVGFPLRLVCEPWPSKSHLVLGFQPLIRHISHGGDDDLAASSIYRLTTQILCAKSVPRADAIGVPPLRALNLALGVWTWEGAEIQLGKTTVNWKQRTLPFPHLVLAIEFRRFFYCASFSSLMEHKYSIFKIWC